MWAFHIITAEPTDLWIFKIFLYKSEHLRRSNLPLNKLIYQVNYFLTHLKFDVLLYTKFLKRRNWTSTCMVETWRLKFPSHDKVPINFRLNELRNLFLLLRSYLCPAPLGLLPTPGRGTRQTAVRIRSLKHKNAPWHLLIHLANISWALTIWLYSTSHSVLTITLQST